MKNSLTFGPGSFGMAAAAVALAAAWACAPKAAHRQTDVMEAGTITVSAAELRAVVNALADRFADQIEETADRIGAATQDPAIRRRALVFEIDAVPAVYTAAYRADPLAGVVDAAGARVPGRSVLEGRGRPGRVRCRAGHRPGPRP